VTFGDKGSRLGAGAYGVGPTGQNIGSCAPLTTILIVCQDVYIRRIWCVHDLMAFPERNGGLVPELA
jgi:hypothetical protein